MKRVHILLSILGLSLAGALLLAQSSTNPAPLINQPLVPAAVAPGAAGFTLTVNGTGFVSGATVNWSGTPLTTTFVSGSELSATVPAANVAAAGTASITVVNPTPGGGVSNVAFLPVTTSAGSVALGQSTVFVSPTFSSPERQAVGDFNGDGKLDLAIADPSGVQVLLGNGDGTFQPPVLYPEPGTGVGSPIVGDFNGDGKPDVAGFTTNAANQQVVFIMLGNGDGTFQPPIESPLDQSISGASELAAGDFNGDGKLDLVVGYNSVTAISVLLGNGDGTFQPFADYQTGPEPGAVAVGDFNGDGKLDVATANFGSFSGTTVSILLGNGDGTFQPHVEYSTTDKGPLSLVAADFNGDGNLDLAVVCSCGHSTPTCGRPGTVAILLGNGDGSFKAPVIYDVDEFPFTITTADFAGDGKLDLAVTDFDSAKISFLLGNGDGTFQPHFEVPLVNSFAGLAGGPVGLVAGDFNRDGLLDLITNSVQLSGEHVAVLMEQIQAPVAALSASSLNFANQDVGIPSTAQAVTLSNGGRASMTVSPITITGTNSSDFGETDNCAVQLRRAPIARST
jgi:VCBS repeat protein/IPT/TIG domain-containing protein